jgi:plasmid maintenance system antidote protein VapI
MLYFYAAMFRLSICIIAKPSKALETTPELWLNLQNSFDVKTAMLEIASELDQIEPVNKAA